MGKRKRLKECPRCHRNCLDEDRAMNAISHIDNKTQICSECGKFEGCIGLTEKGLGAPPIPKSEFILHEEFLKFLKAKK